MQSLYHPLFYSSYYKFARQDPAISSIVAAIYTRDGVSEGGAGINQAMFALGVGRLSRQRDDSFATASAQNAVVFLKGACPLHVAAR